MHLVIAGCLSNQDIRCRLENEVRPKTGTQQTQFAYIGSVDSPQGRLYVAVQRIILTGMLAPRGNALLHIYDHECRLMQSYSLANMVEPLWCEESKIYLSGFGYNADIPPAKDLKDLFDYPKREKELGYPTGNVIDFSGGAKTPVMRRERKYGSSGGIRDNPLSLDPPQ
jgi:hypothetical protein